MLLVSCRRPGRAPIWSVTCCQGRGLPSCSRLSRSDARMVMMRSAMPFTSWSHLRHIRTPKAAVSTQHSSSCIACSPACTHASRASPCHLRASFPQQRVIGAECSRFGSVLCPACPLCRGRAPLLQAVLAQNLLHQHRAVQRRVAVHGPRDCLRRTAQQPLPNQIKFLLHACKQLHMQS